MGEDFFLAFSPARVDPGRTDWTTYNTPKVISSVTPAPALAAADCVVVETDRDAYEWGAIGSQAQLVGYTACDGQARLTRP